MSVRTLLGHLAVGVLNLLRRLPMGVSLILGAALLPFYIPFRFRVRAKLRNLRPPVGAFRYYRMRLRLALMAIQGTSWADEGWVEGGAFFAGVLSSAKPVLLLGWHQGPVEALHEIPATAAAGRSFQVMTAAAFSPALTEWMARRRRRAGVTVVRPDERASLRQWARGNGILALMVDQVPGEPEEWLTLAEGSVKVPWAGRLVEWALGRNPEILAVSTRLEKGRIAFRYDRVPREAVKETVATLMDAALARAPEQYNWSYGKAFSLQPTANSNTNSNIRIGLTYQL